MAPPPAPARARRRSGLRSLLALVALLALFFWAWRRAGESGPAHDLAAAIRSGAAEDRLAAMDALIQLQAEEAAAAAPALLAALDDPDPRLRSRAAARLAYALQGLATPGEVASASAALERALGHADPDVRGAAAELLGMIHTEGRTPYGPAVTVLPREVETALVAAASDPHPSVRAGAVDSLGAGMADPGAREKLLRAAALDPAVGVRCAALRGLGPFASKSPEARMILIRSLHDLSSEVRHLAAHGSDPLGPIPAEAVPDLIAALEDRAYDDAWRKALECLARAGPAARSAAPAVLAIARRHEWSDHEAMQTLGIIAPGSPEARAAASALIDQLRGPKGTGVPSSAARALAAFTWDPEVVAALRQATVDGTGPHDHVGRWAAASLGPLLDPEPEPEPEP